MPKTEDRVEDGANGCRKRRIERSWVICTAAPAEEFAPIGFIVHLTLYADDKAGDPDGRVFGRAQTPVGDQDSVFEQLGLDEHFREDGVS